MAFNLFEPEEGNIFGGSRKGVAFVRRMMRKTKQRHNGVYRKPPAVPFSYDAKQPEDWSEFIQKKFGPDGADVVKYKRPAPRQKSDEEKEYDKVHRWTYWGIENEDLAYDEDQKKWWIGDTDYSFPPIHWKAPDGKRYWGLPHYESKTKGEHYDKIAFPLDNYPATTGEFSSRYAKENKGGETAHSYDEEEIGSKEYRVLDGVVSHSKEWLGRRPRYYYWVKYTAGDGGEVGRYRNLYDYTYETPTDGKPNTWSRGIVGVRRGGAVLEEAEPADEANTPEEKAVAIKQIQTAITEIKTRIRNFGELNIKANSQEQIYGDAESKAKDIVASREASKEYGKGWGVLSQARRTEEIRKMYNTLDARDGAGFKEKAFPMTAGVGGKSFAQLENYISHWNGIASQTSENVAFYLELLTKNVDLVEELGGEADAGVKGKKTYRRLGVKPEAGTADTDFPEFN